ncbi:hypothetical protein N9V26_03590, partial [Amylibacter sp.]|nr:hypothetical protein [Amylibacter sp.]
EWRYRTMQQRNRRIYHVIFSAIISSLLSLTLISATSLCIAASIYFILNYSFQYLSFLQIVTDRKNA